MYYLASIDWGNVNWNALGVIVTITIAICGGLTWAINRAFKFGEISNRLGSVEGDIKGVKDDIKDLRKDLTRRIDEILTISTRKDLAESHSPMQLSEKGMTVLKNSGIAEIVDSQYEKILDKVKKLKPANSYQAEQAVLSVVTDLDKDPVLKDAIEEGAFNSGYVKGSVLFVGGLYIRDRVLESLGLNVDDIDKHKPTSDSK